MSNDVIYCNLSWTATGDNGEAVTGYEIQAAANLDTNQSITFNSSDLKFGSLEPLLPGETQSVVLEIPGGLVEEAMTIQNETGSALELYITLHAYNNESEYSSVSNLAVLSLDPVDLSEAGDEHSMIVILVLGFVGIVILGSCFKFIFGRFRNSKV